MPGEIYTQVELMAMGSEEFEAARRNNFYRPSPDQPSGADLTGANPIQVQLRSAAPALADPYAPKVWGQVEFDFTVPSGQTCRLRKPPMEKLLEAGIIDRLSDLPKVAQDLVDRAEGLPPEKQAEMLEPDTIRGLIGVLDLLLPLVVVAPVIHSVPPDGEERKPDRIYTDSIDLEDRVAIMERTLGSVKKLTTFREQSGPAL